MANIDQTKELNKLLEQQAKIIAAQEAGLKSQLLITQQLVAAMRDLPMDDLADSSANLSRAIKDASKSMGELGENSSVAEELQKALESAVSESDDLGKSITMLGKKFLKWLPVIGAVDGVISGFRVLYGVLSSIGSVGSSVISTLFQVGASILAIPFKILNGLMGMAAQGGSADLRKAMEELRAEMGDLAKNESRAVMDAWRSVDHFGGKLAETGLSIWRTMGNMAESLRALTAIAKNMGVVFSNLQQEFRGNAERIFAYVKGLHLTEEAQKGLAERSYALGVDVTEMGRQITQMAFGMGDAFGYNGALISRDIGEMITDFSNFGNIAVAELSEIAIYARRLGVEVKALLGVVDQFDNFEDAATSVAQLSQAFGLQLDTLDLLKAQNPADRIEQLRKAFFAAGKSVENMTRQERALLAQQTGLDQNTLSLVFSQQNAAKSYEEIQKQSEATEKQQISQAEAMQKLAGSIERLVKSGGGLRGGFFDIFFQGFLKGIRWTREFYSLMWSLRRAMREVYWAGIRVGRAFVEMFPGVKDLMTGIADLFNPRRWRTMTHGIVDIFKKFFSEISGGNKDAVANLFSRLQDNFGKYFNSSGGGQILNGVKSFGKAIVSVFTQAFKIGVESITSLIRGIADGSLFEAAAGPAGRAGRGTMGVLGEIFSPLIEMFTSPDGDFWKSEGGRLIEDLGKAVSSLVKKAWEWAWPKISDFLSDNWKTIGLVFLGPAAIGALTKSISYGIGTMLIGGVGKGLSMFAGRGPGMIANVFSKISGDSRSITKGAAIGKAATDGAAGMTKSVEQLGRANISGKAVSNMALMGVVLVAGLATVVGGMILLAQQIQQGNLTVSSIATAGGVMIASGLVMVELAGVAAILSKTSAMVQPSSILKGLAAIAVVGGAMALGAWGLIEAFKDYSEADISRTVKIMGATSLFFLAAGAVTAVAAAIGTAIIATGGAGGLAILAGLATLGAVIVGMTATTAEIVERVNAIRINQGSERKLDVFVKVLGAIGNFARAITPIIQATTPSILEFNRGAPSMTEKLEYVGRFVRDLGNEIRVTVQELITQANNLNGADGGAVEKAAAIAGILESVGNVATAMRPPEEFLDVGLWDSLRGETVTSRLIQLTNYVSSVFSATKDAFSSIVREFGTIASTTGFTAESANAAKAIGEIIQSVGQLARSMTIFISRQYATTDPDQLRALAPVLGETISSILTAIAPSSGGNIFRKIGSVIGYVVDSVKGLNATQLNAVKTASPIIEATFTAMSSIAALMGNIGLGNAVSGNPEQTQKQVDQLVRLVNAITYGLGNNISNIIGTLSENFKGLTKSQAQNIKAGLEAVSQVFTSLDSITNLANSFQGESTDMFAAGARISDFLTVIYQMFGSSNGGIIQFTSILPGLLNAIGNNSNAIAEAIPNFGNVLRQIYSVSEGINRIFSSDAMKGIGDIEESGIQRIQEGVTGMINSINNFAGAIRGVKGVNLTAELEALNDRLGLKSTGRLTIRQQPVELNINFNITLDSEELEKTLVGRPNTRISTVDRS